MEEKVESLPKATPPEGGRAWIQARFGGSWGHPRKHGWVGTALHLGRYRVQLSQNHNPGEIGRPSDPRAEGTGRAQMVCHRQHSLSGAL